jgi:hypothetical protein
MLFPPMIVMILPLLAIEVDGELSCLLFPYGLLFAIEDSGYNC